MNRCHRCPHRCHSDVNNVTVDVNNVRIDVIDVRHLENLFDSVAFYLLFADFEWQQFSENETASNRTKTGVKFRAKLGRVKKA